MPSNNTPQHFVVDGSNIATEGRSRPSLEQLNEAVLAFMKQYPDTTITVVVDATFGHRIDSKEVKAFDEAVANNELVAPPAGAIGRGDAFVLQIADQANAGVLSNDSFQEFHGDYEWLFDEGRLVGGKPVPNVGWVFVNRSPVRGPKSRASMRKSRPPASPEDIKNEKERAASRFRRKGEAKQVVARGHTTASGDDRVTADADSNGASGGTSRVSRRSSRGRRGEAQTVKNPAPTTASSKFVNDLMPFIDFVEHHPVGAKISAIVDRYSSHGAYLRADDVSLYLPLQFIADPAPNSARSVMALDDKVEVIVVGFQPDRRSVDVATPDQAPAALTEYGVDPAVIAAAERAELAKSDPEATPVKKATTKKAASKKAATKKSATKKAATKKAATKNATATKATATKAAAKATGSQPGSASDPATEAESELDGAGHAPQSDDAGSVKASADNGAGDKTAKKAATKKAAAKKASANKTAAKKASAKKASAKQAATGKAATGPAGKQTSAQKSPAKKAAAKKAPTKKAAAKATASKRAGSKAPAAKKTAAKKTASKKPAAQ